MNECERRTNDLVDNYAVKFNRSILIFLTWTK